MQMGLCPGRHVLILLRLLGSPREHISRLVSQIAPEMVEDFEIPLAEMARRLDVST